MAFYDKNRTMLYEGLTNLDLPVSSRKEPFYLWVKSPVDNEEEFVEEGKKLHLLMVKGSAFGCGGFVRQPIVSLMRRSKIRYRHLQN